MICSDLFVLNYSIGTRVDLSVLAGWKSYSDPFPGCDENTINTLVFIRFHFV